MSKYYKNYFKYFFTYWLILPTVQILVSPLIYFYDYSDYRINSTLILLLNFLIIVNHSKKMSSFRHLIGLAFSSLVQYLLIGLYLSDFGFVIFLIPSVTVVNLLTLFLLNKYKTRKAIIFVFLFIIFLGGYFAKPVSKYILTYDKDINSKLDFFPEIALVKENEELFVFENDVLYFLNFWSIYCSKCIKEMPDYDKLVTSYPDVRFVKVLYASDSISIVKANKITDEYSFDKIRLLNHIDFVDSIKNPSFPHLIVVKNNKILYNGYPFFESDFLNPSIEDLIHKFVD